MPNPRRPGDPHPRGRGLARLAALLAPLLGVAQTASAATAQPAGAAPPVTSTPPQPAPPTAPTADPGTPSATGTGGPPATASAATPPPTGSVPPASSRPDSASPGPTVTATSATADAPATPSARVPARTPPRVDGPYIGGTIAAGGSFARVNNFPTPDPLSGATASVRVGQAIYPWMTIGLEITGTWAYRFADPRQRLLQGAALIDFGFLPVPRIPLSLHVGFGAGGGAVRQADRTARSGFGGAVFSGAVRYEIFPLAARKRPRRGGGFSLGPELGWLGFPPAARGRPMSNTVYVGLFMGFYFGS